MTEFSFGERSIELDPAQATDIARQIAEQTNLHGVPTAGLEWIQNFFGAVEDGSAPMDTASTEPEAVDSIT